MHSSAADALLTLVIVNTALLAIFAFSFARYRARRDWRSLGILSAFVLALFTEMFGFPLTIYLLSGWLASRYPEVDPFSYAAGRFWHTLLGDAYPIYALSYALVAGGFILIAVSWRILYEAQRNGRLARTGPYSRMRHPQYVGFVLVVLGVLLTWPALSTLIMFPILLAVYVLLARAEERESLAKFGDEYRCYMAITPAFLPRLSRSPREGSARP
jgi:methanethiol S-methyltransferase